MSLLFCDSFDHYTKDQMATKWLSAAGNFSINASALLSQDLTDKESGVWSYRVRATDGTDWSNFSNVESTQVDLPLSSTTRIAISI